jgi:ATP-binding cassette subfamily B protein
MAGANLREIDQILTIPLSSPPEKPQILPNYRVEWKDVSFSYSKGGQVLKNLSFTLQEGCMTALVGPSGSGKSTVLKLMAGFYEPDKGEILVGGVPLGGLNSADRLKLISYVFQDNYLFDISIEDNIRLGKADATLEEVKAAAKSAAAQDFIMEFPEGYGRLVGEGGLKLSGGERQRVAISRAILKNSPIVVLDEATAFIDPGNEGVIYESLNNLLADKTVLVVAHRLSSVKGAKVIHVLDQGEIKASGTHEELLKSSKLYRELWEAQFWESEDKAC